jgi:SET domain-containing protein
MRSNAALADTSCETVAVKRRGSSGSKGVFAKESIEPDAIILQLQGSITTRPTKFTIQLSPDCHLEAPPLRDTDLQLNYAWLFLNHSCDPNGSIDASDRTFRALRSIAAGEEITFNYLTTEAKLAAPFVCSCGAANCFGQIRGYDFPREDASEDSVT